MKRPTAPKRWAVPWQIILYLARTRSNQKQNIGQIQRLVIAHQDWLVRFGYGYFEAFCERHHTELVVIDGETLSPEQELVQDLVTILTVFSARLPGLRSYRKVIKDAALQKDQAQHD